MYVVSFEKRKFAEFYLQIASMVDRVAYIHVLRTISTISQTIKKE